MDISYPTIRSLLIQILILYGLLPPTQPFSFPINGTAKLSSNTSVDWPWPDWGINCHGSHWCKEGFHIWQQVPYDLADLNKYITEIPDPSRWIWSVNAHIACKPAFHYISLWTLPGFWCLFTQGNVRSGVVDGKLVKRKVLQLLDHGCRRCGSVPLRDDNNPAYGILTMNFVSHSDCGNGLCSPSQILSEAKRLEIF